MSTPLVVMLVEDHDALREATARILQQRGYAVVDLSCAEDVDDTPVPRRPDLYVIDLNLPGEDGLSLAKRLRQAQPFAGIVITTARTQLSDRLTGYEAGADLYLPKPVDPQELLAALTALAKRLRHETLASTLTLNDQTQLLRGPGGEYRLAESEVRLLVALATARDQTLERWQVAQQLSPDNVDISADNLQNRISLLRKKIASCGIEGESVKAIRGSGYRLCASLVVV
ncbi:MAG: response regulator transcription factor [Curvibacter sp.]